MRESEPPSLSDIQSALEQLPDTYDWFWKGLIVAASWEAAKWAWHHREAILSKVGKRQPILLSGTIEGGGTFEGTLTVGSERQLLWNIEAPTPSLARRLEELVSWYLHVS